MVRAISIFVVTAALVVLTVENAVTVLPLVVLGQPLLALPLSVWILGAIAAGAATTLIFAGLVQIGNPRLRRSDTYAPNVSYGFRNPPQPKPPGDSVRDSKGSRTASREVWDEPDFQRASTVKSTEQTRRTDTYEGSRSVNRSSNSGYGASGAPARSVDDWENRRPLNLESWDDWGSPSRSASPPSNRTSQIPFNPPPYRPPSQTYSNPTSYTPPVVDAEVVTPRRPAEDEDPDEDYYLDEDDYRGEASDSVAPDRDWSDTRRGYPDDYGDNYQSSYPQGDQDNYSRASQEPERDWQDYGDRSPYSAQDEYADYPNEYDDESTGVYVEDDVEPDDYQAPFSFYREPGTEFEWPQDVESDRPEETEASSEDVWELWEESGATRSDQSSSDAAREPVASPGSSSAASEADIWDDWDEDTSSSPPPAPDPEPPQPRVTITEVQRSPVRQTQAGTIYSYSYRRSDDSLSSAEPALDDGAAASPVEADSSDRVLITPPAPEATENAQD